MVCWSETSRIVSEELLPTATSRVVKPILLICKTAPAGAVSENEPSALVTVVIFLPFTVTVAPGIALSPSLDTTLPVTGRPWPKTAVFGQGRPVTGKVVSSEGDSAIAGATVTV